MEEVHYLDVQPSTSGPVTEIALLLPVQPSHAYSSVKSRRLVIRSASQNSGTLPHVTRTTRAVSSKINRFHLLYHDGLDRIKFSIKNQNRSVSCDLTVLHFLQIYGEMRPCTEKWFPVLSQFRPCQVKRF